MEDDLKKKWKTISEKIKMDDELKKNEDHLKKIYKQKDDTKIIIINT